MKTALLALQACAAIQGADAFSRLVATLEGGEAAATKLRASLPMEQIVKASTFMVRGPAACASEAYAGG